MTEIIDETILCVDCALIIANDDSGMVNGEAHRAAMAAHFALYWEEGWTIVVTDGGDNFSTRECGGCGTYMGGERLNAVVLSS